MILAKVANESTKIEAKQQKKRKMRALRAQENNKNKIKIRISRQLKTNHLPHFVNNLSSTAAKQSFAPLAIQNNHKKKTIKKLKKVEKKLGEPNFCMSR